MFTPGIYRSYDIRGIVPTELDATEAYHIGRAYAQYTGVKKVVVARDMRPSGDDLTPEVIRGLTEGGVDVLDMGLATSPMFYFGVHALEADGGLMVTASHNPGKYNGVKMTRAKAVPIGGDTGLMDIRDLVEKRDWAESERVGQVTTVNVRDEYVANITKGVDASGFTIVVDTANGMAGLLAEEYFEKISAKAIPLFWDLDGTFPNHEADPLTEENRVAAEAAVKEHKADIGVMFDGDGDRVFFIDETGATIPGDLATALIGEEVLKENPGATILCDLRASRAVGEAAEEAGGKAILSKVGHSNIKAQMRKDNAVFAGEVSGHFYFTPWYAESAYLALSYVLKLMKQEGKTLSQLVAPLMRYAKTPEINFEVEDKDAVLAAIKEKYADADILELDGISIQYKDWWANIRASNTEPLLRLNMEADTPELLAEKRAEIEGILQS